MTINADIFGRVAVLMGGLSSEREISLISGKRILKALIDMGVDAFSIDVNETIVHQLTSQKIDLVFNSLHGGPGENGQIQGLLDCLAIPYTGSDLKSSALAMDKQRSKYLWLGSGISTLPFVVVSSLEQLKPLQESLKYPLIIKPSSEGSSVGIKKVSSKEYLVDAVEEALKFSAVTIIEPFIDHAEYTVAILDDQALPVIKVETPLHEFYDFDAKYRSNTTNYLIPSGLTCSEEKEIQHLALSAFRSLGCRHWGRVDIVKDNKGTFWVLEVNTIPGMTEHSLVPKAALEKGIKFNDLVVKILSLCVNK